MPPDDGVVAPPQRDDWGGSECGNKNSGANFPIVFHCNYGFILLSFRDMTMGRTTDEVDGQTDVGNQRISGP